MNVIFRRRIALGCAPFGGVGSLLTPLCQWQTKGGRGSPNGDAAGTLILRVSRRQIPRRRHERRADRQLDARREGGKRRVITRKT